jgi:hypothetical protein
VTFYHKETGLLHPLTIVTNDDKAVELNTPADHIAIDHPEESQFDHRTQRVDLATGDVVSHEPSPSLDWRAPFEAARINGALRAQLVNQQHSLVRRLALDPSDADARRALTAIDDELTRLSRPPDVAGQGGG